jgi:excinuclease ABC subunit B
MYADEITRSMKAAMHETNRRRGIQQAHNRRHGITPKSIQKEVTRIFDFVEDSGTAAPDRVKEAVSNYSSIEELDTVIQKLEKEMQAAARDLEFERAAELRDEIKALKKLIVMS